MRTTYSAYSVRHTHCLDHSLINHQHEGEFEALFAIREWFWKEFFKVFFNVAVFSWRDSSTQPSSQIATLSILLVVLEENITLLFSFHRALGDQKRMGGGFQRAGSGVLLYHHGYCNRSYWQGWQTPTDRVWISGRGGHADYHMGYLVSGISLIFVLNCWFFLY